MNAFLIRNARLVEPGVRIRSGDLLVRGGRIAAMGEIENVTSGISLIEASGRLLTPGLIDVHTHGIGRSLYASGNGLRAAARELGRFGVTTVLPTIVPQMQSDLFARLAEISEALPSV